jgi:hypothetical protein
MCAVRCVIADGTTDFIDRRGPDCMTLSKRIWRGSAPTNDASGYGLVLGLIGAGSVFGVIVIARLRTTILTSNALLSGSSACYVAAASAPVEKLRE